jgi:signal transduction histidine kinase
MAKLIIEDADATAGESSSGMNLAIARRGMERMGGRADARTVDGVTRSFTIELPLDPQSP